MEALEPRRKEEIETAKARLDKTKKMIAETLESISRTEQDRQERLQQWSRKHKDLQTTEGTQLLRISKLNEDLENTKTILQLRTEEHAHLLKTNEEWREELKALQDASQLIELRKKLDLMEDNIKKGYEDLQNVKDAEALLDMSPGDLLEEAQIPYVEEMLRKRKLRKEEIYDQLKELEDTEKQMNAELKKQTEQLTLLKDRYSSLNRVYDMSKRAKL